MAFDPIQEDCLRLILQSMSRQNIMPLDNAEFIQRQMDEYRQNPDSLVVSDQDRSFHLVAKAAELADYRIPFMTDEEEAMRNDAQAEAYLREAVELDPKNWDAQRMLTAMCADSNDAYVSYLIDQRQAVADDIAAGIHAASTPYEKEFASDLASRPYLRWLAALSSHAFICGQYTLAFNTAIELLDIDPLDFAGVRYTAYLALAKLECTVSDIKRLRARCARAESGPQAGCAAASADRSARTPGRSSRRSTCSIDSSTTRAQAMCCACSCAAIRTARRHCTTKPSFRRGFLAA